MTQLPRLDPKGEQVADALIGIEGRCEEFDHHPRLPALLPAPDAFAIQPRHRVEPERVKGFRKGRVDRVAWRHGQAFELRDVDIPGAGHPAQRKGDAQLAFHETKSVGVISVPPSWKVPTLAMASSSPPVARTTGVMPSACNRRARQP